MVVSRGPEIDAGPAVTILKGRYARDPFGDDAINWDIAPDGERFIFVEEAPRTQDLVVVLNWTEELKQLVPTDN